MYTLKQAKKDCVEMWDWLRKNQDKDKDDYFRSIGIEEYEEPLNQCAMCEYVSATLSDCNDCPIWGNDFDLDELFYVPCEKDRITYNAWGEAAYHVDKMKGLTRVWHKPACCKKVGCDSCDGCVNLKIQLRKKQIAATELLKKALMIKA